MKLGPRKHGRRRVFRKQFADVVVAFLTARWLARAMWRGWRVSI